MMHLYKKNNNIKMFLLLKYYFEKFKKRVISKDEIILRKKFEKNMRLLFDKKIIFVNLYKK
jgi:hypothetical protein